MDTAIGRYKALRLKLKKLEAAEPEALEQHELLRQEMELVYCLATEREQNEIDMPV